jgi:UDP-N-acetyl-D-galactosamine dehydrogenase
MKYNIAVIGLGYVGLPLALEFCKKYNTTGFDINSARINSLKNGVDVTNEVDTTELVNSKNLNLTESVSDIKKCNVYIITVPTPINEFKSPDLDPLKKATSMVGNILSEGDIVIYESTVFPGCTEDVCVPILENSSDLIYNKQFFCGYSPERINPGDKINTLTKIIKVTSGSDEKTALLVNDLYLSIISAGTHLAPSIKVAEASKAIENAQRDLNISFVNELSLIFDRIGIDTQDVIDAAGTKWNFLTFKPGLVGGHCIGVDPYYLAHKAESLGYHPEVILSGRRVNDNMASFISYKLVKLMINKSITIRNSRVLILGFTFKENCPDTRNTKIINVNNELIDFGIDVDIYDPNADKSDVKKEYDVDLINNINNTYDSILVAVAHNEFKNLDLKKYLKKNSVVFDLKGICDRDLVDSRL